MSIPQVLRFVEEVFLRKAYSPNVGAVESARDLSDQKSSRYTNVGCVLEVLHVVTLCWVEAILLRVACLTFRRLIKSRLPFAGIIRRLPYSTRFQDKG